MAVTNIRPADKRILDQGGRLKLEWDAYFSRLESRLNEVVSSAGVTSVNVSGGTTGLTFSGGPITTSGTITASGTLAIGNGGTGQASAAAAFAALKQAATTSVTGVVELATSAETTTGTDSDRAITPDALAGSDFGKRIISIMVESNSNDLATGDGLNGNFIRIPSELDGYNLVDVGAQVGTAGTTGTTDIQIHNVTDGVDMLSTKITIDSGETDSATAATPPVINASNDDVAEGDQLRIDVDAIQSGTAPKGLIVTLSFQLS